MSRWVPLQSASCLGLFALLGGAALAGCAVNAEPVDTSGAAASADTVVTVTRPASSVSCSAVIDPLREIEIVHPSVVDPTKNGGLSSNATAGAPWSFRTAVEQLAPSESPADVDRFVDSLFDSFTRRIDINSNGRTPDFAFEDDLTPRGGDFDKARRVFNRGGAHSYDLAKAPFELIAIANRLDLRNPGVDAGEGRLVFGATEAAAATGDTIIFEYKLPLIPGDLDSPEKWAAEWHKLGGLVVGSAAYNRQLVAITSRFTRRVGGKAPRLSQLRTNEFAFDFDWELREFHVDPKTGLLAPATTVNTPNVSLNRTPALAAFVKQNTAALLGPDFLSFTMPTSFTFTEAGASKTVRFLGAKAERQVPWSVPEGSDVDPKALERFSTLTCNGCHSIAAKDPGPVFQIAPGPTTGDGTDRLARFVFDPSKADDDSNPPDDVRRRKVDMRPLLCDPGGTVQVTFVIDGADFTRPGQDIYVVGSIPELGNWSAAKGVRLGGQQFPRWTGSVTLPRGAHVEFKAIEVESGAVLRWETGQNRVFDVPRASAVTVQGTFRR